MLFSELTATYCNPLQQGQGATTAVPAIAVAIFSTAISKSLTTPDYNFLNNERMEDASVSSTTGSSFNQDCCKDQQLGKLTMKPVCLI